ncbi:MAG TPA: hypothetical protein PKU97_10300, partial [Kofleriaceae bacterium]|nr:hypothetical protein [Kofleriaceae bacterium]
EPRELNVVELAGAGGQGRGHRLAVVFLAEPLARQLEVPVAPVAVAAKRAGRLGVLRCARRGAREPKVVLAGRLHRFAIVAGLSRRPSGPGAAARQGVIGFGVGFAVGFGDLVSLCRGIEIRALAGRRRREVRFRGYTDAWFAIRVPICINIRIDI